MLLAFPVVTVALQNVHHCSFSKFVANSWRIVTGSTSLGLVKILISSIFCWQKNPKNWFHKNSAEICFKQSLWIHKYTKASMIEWKIKDEKLCYISQIDRIRLDGDFLGQLITLKFTRTSSIFIEKNTTASQVKVRNDCEKIKQRMEIWPLQKQDNRTEGWWNNIPLYLKFAILVKFKL